MNKIKDMMQELLRMILFGKKIFGEGRKDQEKVKINN